MAHDSVLSQVGQCKECRKYFVDGVEGEGDLCYSCRDEEKEEQWTSTEPSTN